MARYLSAVDGIEYKALNLLTGTPSLSPGVGLGSIGQTGNTIATNVANQAQGTSPQMPALAAAAVSTLVVANTLVTASSMIWCQVSQGTTVPAANTDIGVTVKSLSAGTSFTVAVRNNGTAATLITDYVFWYWIVN